MPKLFDLLSDSQRQTAQTIISQLEERLPHAARYNEQLNLYQRRLDGVQVEEELFAIVQEIIATDKEIQTDFSMLFKAPDSQVKAAIEELISTEKKYASIQIVLNFYSLVQEFIHSTKERLSAQSLSAPLPSKQQEIFSAIIQRIRTLKPIARELQELKKEYQQRLAAAKTLNEVNQLEEEIESRNKRVASIYEAAVEYPTDEATAGALIKFLETNIQIRAIMQAFDFHESLMDDILAARAELLVSNLNSNV